MRNLKASEFANAFEFEAAKVQAKKEHKAKRTARASGRGRSWEAAE